MEVKGSKIQACCPYYNHILLYRKQNTLLTIISNHKTEITEPKHYHRVRSGKKSRGNNNTLCHKKNFFFDKYCVTKKMIALAV